MEKLPQVFNPEAFNIKNQQATSLANLFDPIGNPLTAPSVMPNGSNRQRTRSTTMSVYAKTDIDQSEHLGNGFRV